MDHAPLVEILVEQLVVPVLLALISAAGAWIVTKLPGPLRDWLQSGTHRRDLDLLGGALANKATELADDVVAGRATVRDAAEAGVAYAKEKLPEVLAKIRPSEDALRTMATAAAKRALKDALR